MTATNTRYQLPKAPRNALILTGVALVLVSLVSWFTGLYVDLPDGGELTLTLAFLAGVGGPLIVFVAAAMRWRHRELFPLFMKLALGVAGFCLVWNVGFWILFLFAYRNCPDGIC